MLVEIQNKRILNKSDSIIVFLAVFKFIFLACYTCPTFPYREPVLRKLSDNFWSHIYTDTYKHVYIHRYLFSFRFWVHEGQNLILIRSVSLNEWIRAIKSNFYSWYNYTYSHEWVQIHSTAKKPVSVVFVRSLTLSPSRWSLPKQAGVSQRSLRVEFIHK